MRSTSSASQRASRTPFAAACPSLVQSAPRRATSRNVQEKSPSRSAPSTRSVACRFKSEQQQQQHRSPIDMMTSQSKFTGDSKSLRGGPLVMAADLTQECSAAMKWALRNLCSPGDTVEVVHVVCDPRGMGSTVSTGMNGSRLRMTGGSEFEAISTEAYMGKLLESTYEKIFGHCGIILQKSGLTHQIHLPRLSSPKSASVIGETLLAEAERLGARMLVIASHGPGALAEYGSVARYCYQHACLPLLLIPSNEKWFLEHPLASHDVASDQPKTTGKKILLCVENLRELEHHWQWVADNICSHGDTLRVWHLSHVGHETKHMPHPGADAALASLPTALTQVLKTRGLAQVEFIPMSYDEAPEIANQVLKASQGPEAPDIVVVLNYVRRGYLWETLHGSVASELARHCPAPLVLLQPPQ